MILWYSDTFLYNSGIQNLIFQFIKLGREMYCLLSVTWQQTQFLTPDITQKRRET